MENLNKIYDAFRDELEKIALGPPMGTGQTRSLIRPRTAQSMASKSGLAAKGVAKFFRKTGGVNPRHVLGGAVTGGALALYGDRKIKKLHADYQAGRAMRQAGMG